MDLKMFDEKIKDVLYRLRFSQRDLISIDCCGLMWFLNHH